MPQDILKAIRALESFVKLTRNTVDDTLALLIDFIALGTNTVEHHDTIATLQQ